jgi:hypothetical protein
VNWINEADPHPDSDSLTLAEVNEERTVYLISDEDAESKSRVERWIRKNYERLFEEELEGWYTDPDLWPKDRTFKMFKEWFEIECHTVLVDTVGGELYDEE